MNIKQNHFIGNIHLQRKCTTNIFHLIVFNTYSIQMLAFAFHQMFSCISALQLCFRFLQQWILYNKCFFCISLVLFKCICCHIIWSLQQWIPIILTQQLWSQHSMPDASLAMTFSMEILIKCPAGLLSKNYLLLHVSQLGPCCSAPF